MEKFKLRQKPSEVADFGQGNAFSCFWEVLEVKKSSKSQAEKTKKCFIKNSKIKKAVSKGDQNWPCPIKYCFNSFESQYKNSGQLPQNRQ